MAETLDVLLSIMLDRGELAKFKQGVSEYEKEIADLDKKIEAIEKKRSESEGVLLKKSLDKDIAQLNDQKRILQERKKTHERIIGDLVAAEKQIQTEQEETARVQAEIAAEWEAKYAEPIKESNKEIVDLEKSKQQVYEDEHDLLAKRALGYTKVADSAEEAAKVSQKIFVAGVGVLTGIFAAANKYAQNAEIATKETEMWLVGMEKIEQSGQRIAAVLVQEALPYLAEAAQLAGKIADYIEQNPEIVRAAVQFGSAAVAVGAIGTVIAKGVQLYSSIAAVMTTAGTMMQKAAKDNLIAAGIMGKGGITPTGVGKTLGTVTLVATSVIIGAELGAALGNALGKLVYGEGYKKQGIREALLTGTRVFKLPTILTGDILKNIGLEKVGQGMIDVAVKTDILGQKLLGLDQTSEQTTTAMEALEQAVEGLGGVGGTGISEDVLDAFVQYRETAVRLEEDFQKERLAIIQDYNNAVNQALESNRAAVAQINQDYQNTVASIMRDAREADIKAEQNYLRRRAQIVRDASRDIQRIEEDLQERLRKLMLDHEDRVAGLVAARDALGLVREQRRYDRERAEAERAANIEIARRRQDVAARLQDLQQQYEMERAQRAQQTQQRLEEAALEHEERLKQQAESHNEELRQLRDAHHERLRELAMQHREEQLRNRQAFIARVRDLDASLLGEQQLRQQYYQAMLQDAQRFFEEYRSNMPGGSGTTYQTPTVRYTGITRQFGGYTPNAGGLVKTHPYEYVMSANTTKAMESLLGGRLSENALQSLARGGGGNVINLSFPGGLVTMRQLQNVLKDNNENMLSMLAQGLA